MTLGDVKVGERCVLMCGCRLRVEGIRYTLIDGRSLITSSLIRRCGRKGCVLSLIPPGEIYTRYDLNEGRPVYQDHFLDLLEDSFARGGK